MPSLERLRYPNPPLEELIQEHGEEAVLDELHEMAYHDMADWALEAALKTGSRRGEVVARSAAQIVVNSGSYGEAARAQARRVLGIK